MSFALSASTRHELEHFSCGSSRLHFHDKRILRVAFGHTFACDVCKERTDGCCLSLSAVVVVLFVVVVH